jgi:hypothetical protein
MDLGGISLPGDQSPGYSIAPQEWGLKEFRM